MKNASGVALPSILPATLAHALTDMSSDAEALLALSTAPIDIEGRMPNSSNATFLVQVGDPEAGIKGIYKPLRGERPLWDFPSGLFHREIAAYLLSEAMGLHVIPPTIERDGPFGPGSLQWFIEARFEEHYFTLYESREDLHDQFRNMAAFDIVANNTDRKELNAGTSMGT